MPQVVTSPEQARAILDVDGAVIFEGCGADAAAARALADAVFADELLAVPAAARVFDGGERDNKGPGIDHTTPLPAHTDGFGYGDFYPDYFLLTCVQSCAAGGESFLVDGYAILRSLAANPATAWAVDELDKIAVDHTETGMQPAVGPILQFTPKGRRMVRKTMQQTVLAQAAARAQQMVDIWRDTVEAAAADAPRFKLQPGQAVVVDNYRMLHGRDAYRDLQRLMWRVWIWTTASKAGAPPLPLHSDTRFAARR